MENALSVATQELPCLTLTDTGNQALVWMHEYQVRHLPVLDNEHLLGLLTEEDILDENPTRLLSEYTLRLNNTCVYEHQSIFEAVKLMSKLDLTCLPVCTKEGIYQGVITQTNLFQSLAVLSSANEAGGILTLTVPLHQYDLGQIVRVVESNNGKILSLFTQMHPDQSYEIILKLNLTDLTRVIATFERFNYEVTEAYYETPEWEDVQDRFDHFLKYLNL